MRRLVAPFLALVTLAVPASASAHSRAATVALDYRLVIDRATRDLPGLRVRILDGDRSLRVGVRHARLVILGDLGEQMLRIDDRGTFVNEGSVTAQAARLTHAGSGWRRIGGSTFAWHDHRLAPPPYDGGQAGTVAHFRIPATLDGKHVVVGGSFVRYRRPSPWAWAVAGALLAAAAIAAARFRPQLRARLSTGLAVLAGAAALTAFVTFGIADAPTGQAAWTQLGLGIALAAAVAIGLVRLGGERRLLLAGLIGAAAAVGSLGTLGVFQHGVVVSVLPAVLSRSVCVLALATGVACAVTVFAGWERAA